MREVGVPNTLLRARLVGRAAATTTAESWRAKWSGWMGRRAGLTTDRAAARAINLALDETRIEDEQRLGREESTYRAHVWLGLRSGHRSVDPEPVLTVESLTGYRAWKLMPGTRLGRPVMDSVLGSRVLRSIWPGPHLQARCEGRGWARLHGPEQLPVIDCTCGVYALKQVPDMRGEAGVWVVGEVSLWGRVLEGEKGFRAEHAQVIGPLTIQMSCAHATGPTTNCGAAPVVVLCRETEYVPRCEDHAAGIEPVLRLEPRRFVNAVACSLTRRYGVDVAESETAAA